MPTKAKPDELGPDDVLLTVKEACKILRCSRPTLFKLKREGRIEMIKYGYRTARIVKRSVDKLLQESGPAGRGRAA
jgi:excisionase family DNA binding protein